MLDIICQVFGWVRKSGADFGAECINDGLVSIAQRAPGDLICEFDAYQHFRGARLDCLE